MCRTVSIALIVWLLSSCPALCDTYCPSVSSVIQTLNPTITAAPKPVKLATYDMNTRGLSVQYAGNRADYFVGVPPQLIVARPSVPWKAIAAYPTALVQEGSTCPILSSAGTPILTMGLAFPTTSPFVMSLCPALTGADKQQLVSLVQAPLSVYQAVYDSTLQWLFVAFVDGESTMFVNVPPSAVASTVIWNDLFSYSEAIMAEPAICPLLAQ